LWFSLSPEKREKKNWLERKGVKSNNNTLLGVIKFMGGQTHEKLGQRLTRWWARAIKESAPIHGNSSSRKVYA